jgi:hypothetical protein
MGAALSRSFKCCTAAGFDKLYEAAGDLAEEAGAMIGKLQKRVRELETQLNETREEVTALRQQQWKRSRTYKGITQIEGSLHRDRPAVN